MLCEHTVLIYVSGYLYFNGNGSAERTGEDAHDDRE